jgi:oxalate decarboxylase
MFFETMAATVGGCSVLAPALLAQTADANSALGAGQAESARRSEERKNEAASKHRTSLQQKKPRFANESGSVAQVDQSDLDVMNRLSIRRLMLAPLGVREPHWHANANELGYCLRGQHLVTIFADHDKRESFTISAGEMFFVPVGALHHIENIGSDEGEFIIGFSHELPEDFGLSGVLGSFTDAALGNTFGLPASSLHSLRRTPNDLNIGSRSTRATVELQEREENSYKYSLMEALPQFSSEAGGARTVKASVWPVLQDITMFSIHITARGMREVHWHPGTAEMGYVVQGRGRMTIVSPGGSLDTYEMSAGDTYFIPRSYPHHIEDLGQDDLRLLVFFDRNMPGDIGMSTAVGAYSRDVVAAALHVDVATVPDFPFNASDVLFLPRLNPIDPAADI